MAEVLLGLPQLHFKAAAGKTSFLESREPLRDRSGRGFSICGDFIDARILTSGNDSFPPRTFPVFPETPAGQLRVLCLVVPPRRGTVTISCTAPSRVRKT